MRGLEGDVRVFFDIEKIPSTDFPHRNPMEACPRSSFG
jgi:hypothetical protein